MSETSSHTVDPWTYAGRRTLVTGAASGIGAAVAREVRRLGGTVIGIDVRDSPDADVSERVDLGDRDAVERFARAAGSVDALFNCAGITGTNPRDRVMAVNFRGLRTLSDALAAQMQPGGAIVNIASVGGGAWRSNIDAVQEYLALDDDAAIAWCDAHPEQFPRGAYSFSKQCVIVWSKVAAARLAARGIRVNSISPGAVDTPLLRDSAAIGGQAAVDAMPKPLGRVAQPDEIATAAAFLGGRAASYITGQDLAVDAGLLGAFAVGDIDLALVPYLTR